MKILEANDLFAGYGKTEILHGVSVQLAEKEIIKVSIVKITISFFIMHLKFL